MAQRFMAFPRQMSIGWKNDAWKQIVSEVPEWVTSLAVDGKVLSVGTEENGVLHFNLGEE